MCIWEWCVENASRPDVSSFREKLGGAAAFRLYCIDLAELAEDVFITLEMEEGHPVMWNNPFDWEIIPYLMSRYISKIEPEYGLLDESVWADLVKEARRVDLDGSLEFPSGVGGSEEVTSPLSRHSPDPDFEALESLRLWLEDNVGLESELHFDNEGKIRSARVLKALEKLLEKT